MFTIPFVFAFYQELLLIDQALIDPTSPAKAPLSGYENGINIAGLIWLLVRLIISLYLVATALAKFDMKSLSFLEVITRLVLALAILMKPEVIHFTALIFSAGFLTLHIRRAHRIKNDYSILRD